jgi:hypothetical protein
VSREARTRSRGGEPEYPGQPTLNHQPSTLNLCPTPQPSTLPSRFTKFSAHPIGNQSLPWPVVLSAAIAPSRCWGAKSQSRAQQAAGRKGDKPWRRCSICHRANLWAHPFSPVHVFCFRFGPLCPHFQDLSFEVRGSMLDVGCWPPVGPTPALRSSDFGP